MKLLLQTPTKSLNASYLKQPLKREQIELFKRELKNTFNHIDEKQDEEYHKNVIADLFKSVYCKDKYLVNVNKKQDLVIRHGNKPIDNVGVILEFKKPTAKAEMVSKTNANVKAMQELVLYYLNQRLADDANHQTQHLIVTNIYEWFIFDELWFDKNIYKNTKLKKDYQVWKSSGHSTDDFYKLYAAKYLAEIEEEVPCTYFNLKDYEANITNEDTLDDDALINLYKVLSPDHLLKQTLANDSNSLNKVFYDELLYILGLEENNDTAKRTIKRMDADKRNEATLLENTIGILKRQKHFGYEDNEETDVKYFEVALELCITWLNRILFLKLLEGQLVKYHKINKETFKFLSYERLKDFDDLDELFFDVLAEPITKRSQSVITKYSNIPYLNSTLFEISDIERTYFAISSLKDRLKMPLFNKTVLEVEGKKATGEKTSLNYLLDFLDAYNFASESNAKIQEENKTIINASVLGLIFEKINGYKDGSFFTPGFITMYMCRETIRKAVVEKFKTEFKGCETITNFEELKDKIDHTDRTQRTTANALINSLKICDPAVGSGHFLVSALNELIKIKSDLQLLCYTDGSLIREYKVALENDELIFQHKETDELFDYALNQNDKPIEDMQKLQEALFVEKQTIIENCLFGVDINPKSVMICRLRLWIELLKNSYYTASTNYSELETLPNIDINIKSGNSLISRFAIKDNVIERIPNFKKQLEQYKNWVSD